MLMVIVLVKQFIQGIPHNPRQNVETGLSLRNGALSYFVLVA